MNDDFGPIKADPSGILRMIGLHASCHGKRIKQGEPEIAFEGKSGKNARKDLKIAYSKLMFSTSNCEKRSEIALGKRVRSGM
jgi:hypothetical protein